MKKNILYAGTSFVIFIVAFLIPGAHSQHSLSELVKIIEPSVVVVIGFDENGDEVSQGSGFFINNYLDFVTSRHVLEGMHSGKIITSGDNVLKIGLILAEDVDSDLLVARPDLAEFGIYYKDDASDILNRLRFFNNTFGSDVNFLHDIKLSKRLPVIAEDIFVIGSPEGLDKTVANGIVSAVRDVPHIGKIIQITAPLSAGSSGSPVLNMNGEVIGVAAFQFVSGQALNFAIPISRLARLLDPATSSYIVRASERIDMCLATWSDLYYIELSRTANDIVDKGMSLMWAGEYQMAINAFKEALEHDPNSSSANFYLGYCYAETGEYRRSIFYFNKAIEIDPRNAIAYYNRAISKSELGDDRSAISDYNKAIEIDPKYAAAYMNRAISKSELGDNWGAIEDYNKAIEINSEYATAYMNRGVSKSRLGDNWGALEDFSKAIEINSEYATAYMNRGISKSRLGDDRSAIADYNKAIEINPRDATAHMNRGISKSELGDNWGAIEDYNKAIEINPEYVSAYFNRGIEKVYLNNRSGGCADIWRAIELGHEGAKDVYKRNCR